MTFPCSSHRIFQMFKSTRPHGARQRAARRGSWGCSVSIHAPARGATFAARRNRTPMACFNPRARTGRDADLIITENLNGRFQSTRPHGARLGTASGSLLGIGFNPRARTGRDRVKRTPLSKPACFNPRARTGRDVALAEGARAGAVSIHAPARGATAAADNAATVEIRFQSTRPHGARRPTTFRTRDHRCFNPRARAGRDESSRPNFWNRSCFNPRARAGRDSIYAASFAVMSKFQSTRPRGARRRRGQSPPLSHRFNPRARAGRDTGS